jgi:hypothetical protein
LSRVNEVINLKFCINAQLSKNQIKQIPEVKHGRQTILIYTHHNRSNLDRLPTTVIQDRSPTQGTARNNNEARMHYEDGKLTEPAGKKQRSLTTHERRPMQFDRTGDTAELNDDDKGRA